MPRAMPPTSINDEAVWTQRWSPAGGLFKSCVFILAAQGWSIREMSREFGAVNTCDPGIASVGRQRHQTG